MIIVIHGVPKEILINTVTIKKGETNNTELFRCYKCGTAVSQIRGETISIYPGLEPSTQVPVISRCFKCGENYVFQSNHFGSSDIIKLSLSHDVSLHDYTTFHCIKCRTQLLQYTAQWVRKLPENIKIPLFYKFDCIHPQCPRKYVLMDVV